MFVAAILKAYETMFRNMRSSGTIPCEPTGPIHRVLIYFSRIGGYWYCAFFDEHRLKVRLPRRVALRDNSKIYEMAKRGNAELESTGAQEEFDRAINRGCGKVWLRLTDEQRATLDRKIAA
jgi:hypothetical protein